jgi:small nuclear ribonucleoprotein D1
MDTGTPSEHNTKQTHPTDSHTTTTLHHNHHRQQQYPIMKLVKFLQKLNREQVTIELKNGTVISGTVVGVDATMNAHLKKAKLTAKGKNPVSYATLSVRGSTVRSWILPDGLNLDALLVEDAPKVRSVERGESIEHSR